MGGETMTLIYYMKCKRLGNSGRSKSATYVGKQALATLWALAEHRSGPTYVKWVEKPLTDVPRSR